MSGPRLIQMMRTIDMLCSHRGVTVEQVADKLEIGRRSAYRMLNNIEDLGFVIESMRDPVENKTRKRINREFHQKLGPINVPDIKLSPSEIIALYLLKGESKILKGSDLEKSVESAFSKIGMFAPQGISEKLSKLQSLFLLDARMSKNYKGKEPVIDQLTDSMLSMQTCYVRYHSFHDDTVKNFKIDPLYFFEHDGGLYLFIRATTFDDILVLAVERIDSINPCDEHYEYPVDFDPNDYLKQTFGLIHDDPLTVKIWFDQSQARYVKERQWSHNQEIQNNKDGSIILKMKTSGRFEIKRWVAGFGAHAKILEPENLREEYKEEVRQVYSQYFKNQ
jgi:predicted DNA-binding transcriptional regulator YafY